MKSDDPAKWGKMWGPFKGDAKVGGVLKVYFCFNLSKLVDEDGEGQSAPEVELSALLEGLPAEEGYVAGTEGGEELSEEAEEAEGPSDLL
eukprot:tig00020563_g11197.t1